METVGQDHGDGGAVPRVASARRRILVLASVLVAMLVVPMVLNGTADAVPTVNRLKTVACDGGTYTVVSGDGWYRIAGKLGVSPAALLAANNATTSTWLFAGDVLCVPGGATTPTVTPTTAKASTTTTVAPTTTVPFKGPMVIRQFPVQGVCWFTDTWGAPRSGGRHHEGVDILAPQGKNVYAVDDGTLTRQYIDKPGALAGNGWRLTRADGSYFFYGHFSGFAPGLQLGSKVKAGQIIGYVGQTGNAGIPHLHFEVHPGGGAAVNPTPFVKAVDGCTTTAVPTQPGQVPPTNTTTPTATTKPVTTTTKPPATTAKPTPTTTKPATTTTKPPVTTTTKPPATTTTLPPPPRAARWQFLTPVMALDTGAIARPLVAQRETRVTVAGLTGVAGDTSGVLVRVVARRATSAGHLTLHRCGAGTNGAASLSFSAGALSATVVPAPVSAGAFCVTASVGVHVRIAVVAEQATTGVGMAAIPARRALDTRSSGMLIGGSTRAITTAQLGIAPVAKAVTVTVTLLGAAVDGGFGIGSCGGTPWIVAFPAGSSNTFSAVVRTNGAGVCVSSSVDVQAVVDVTGVWSGSISLSATAPSRVFDSGPAQFLGTATTTARVAIPGSSSSAQLAISVRAGSASASVVVWNCADRRPAGAVAYAPANGWVTVAAGMNTRGGSLCISSSAPARVIIDVLAAA